jgi:hypothetical protein
MTEQQWTGQKVTMVYDFVAVALADDATLDCLSLEHLIRQRWGITIDRYVCAHCLDEMHRSGSLVKTGRVFDGYVEYRRV